MNNGRVVGMIFLNFFFAMGNVLFKENISIAQINSSKMNKNRHKSLMSLIELCF